MRKVNESRCVTKTHANGRNIVGPNMFRPFAWNHNNVGTCCVSV